jgi:FkbM family methyltransferase
MLYYKLNKPEFWFRPSQIFRKLGYVCGRYASTNTVSITLPWGAVLQVNPHETIGRSLTTSGIYDLAVSEALWRLTEPGDWCMDIGTNIGYMTSLLAAKAQPSGKVFSFEPHPVIFGRFQANLKSMAKSHYAPIQPNQIAVGTTDGKTNLVEPDEFEINEGVAKLANNESEGTKSFPVSISRLDTLFSGNEKFGVVKVDVEGFEISVFRGAEQLLAKHKIRDIVFEDFEEFPSESVKFLQGHGYTIFRLVKKILGPYIWNPLETKDPNFLLPYEPINYLATVDPQRALKLLQPRGWLCLKAGR